jgi:tetratricopeptide (TPR) repeat protein
MTEQLLQEGISALKRGDKARARACLLAVVKREKGNELAWLWLSGAVEKDDERLACLEKVLAINPANERARQGLAWLRSRLPPPPEPQDIPCPFCGTPVPLRETTCPACGENQTVTCPSCGNSVGVESPACPRCGQETGEAKAGVAAYYSALGDAYREQGKWGMALEAWQHALSGRPSQPGLHRRIAAAHKALGQSAEAIASYKQALEEDPGDVEATLHLIESYAAREDWKQAEEIYRQVRARKKSSSAMICGLGDLALRRNDFRRALNAYEEAARGRDLDDEGRALVYARLGRLYDLRGDENKAVRTYRRAEALAPEGQAGRLARRQLADIRPPMPDKALADWAETLREMAGPVLGCALLLGIQAGFNPYRLTLTGMLGLMLAAVGVFCLVCATSTPRNGIFTLLLGKNGLERSPWRWALGGLGAISVLLALALILLFA